MGVTIHFSGKLKSPSELKILIEYSKNYAEVIGVEIKEINEKSKRLLRVQDGEDWDYIGIVEGVKFQPHENSEILNLEFDENLYIQEYCKTQFSTVQVHIEIINFLRRIESLFEKLDVIDEGEYWEYQDEEILKKHFENCFKIMEEEKMKNKNVEGPIRMSDGRIIDLMEN